MSGNTQQRSGQHDFRQVLQPSPFHPRVEEHCRVKNWTSWNGYQTARVYDTLAAEYFAIRSSCSVMDLTPMEKYRIGGPDALKFLNRLVARDISGLKPNRVTYVLWCNDEGKVLDDGTIFHLRQGEYRLCSQHHQLDWLLISALGMDVSVIVETHEIAALAVQGPTAYSVLTAAGFEGLDKLKPFGILYTQVAGFELMVSRTGYTGDLGYELWTDPSNALALWDAVFEVRDRGLYDLRCIGLDALEMVRIEAGFIMPADDFNTAETTVRAGHDRSPFEIGLGWVVNFDKPHFTGKQALLREKSRPIKRRLVKLAIDGNKPPIDSFLYDGKKGRRIGTIKTQIWSPILKANLAMADVEYRKGKLPKEIWAEIYYQKELEWQVSWARCRISETPFWTHPRRSATPPQSF
ncbi:MAG TPA: aminomethyl transferase family protein [Gammaproteobacteria bacterium]|jgi:aminomethyltransferase|nr:aminomethyl transferase family protein [Gammaproteobacteria bacterium]HIF85711.1 aminomethyl transferase family protein [Gammaproteobacteria bacterium]|tara:strand:- start:57092 stop:58312 length:1221 start_codon:yes stop_codon:yes gene_type:complete